MATVTNPGSFMATITHPTGNGYCRDRILRDRTTVAIGRLDLIALIGGRKVSPCILLVGDGSQRFECQ